ncbi:hypothetical protein ASN88_02060 [Streptococcus parauberis]|uniref:hypothetical protein n=1 Tax=Streptococcus parauberis TaxID=1348 RepID=UPI000CCE9A52|nr:hypothetical protein [Streptococcus parauberis]PNY20687.1 hypothetical protein ASN88_02060 [Streptococcus parauberis]
MKVGMRTPSLKKSFKARTTGKVKKQMKKSVNPLYGKKGMGLVDNPKKAVYNKVYNKTTVDGLKPLKVSSSKKTNKANDNFGQVLPLFEPKVTEDIIVHKKKFWTIVSYFFAGLFVVEALQSLFNKNFVGFIIGLGFALLIYKLRQNVPEQKQKTITRFKTEEELSSEKLNLMNDKISFDHSLEMYNQGVNLMQSTLNPDTFVANYKLAVDSLTKVVDITEKYKDRFHVEADNLETALQRIISEKAYIEEEFIQRYYFNNVKKANELKTETGKANNLAKGKEKIMQHEELLNQKSVDLINTLYK